VNHIQTWSQGFFVDGPNYRHVDDKTKEKWQREEECRVRSGPTENAICMCLRPESAKWIAERLNLASKLEAMAYNYATGKTNGDELVSFVKKCAGYQ